MRSVVLPILAAAFIAYFTAPLLAACPSRLTNGTTADAGPVMDWFDCKAPLNGPLFTGNVGIGDTSPGAKLSVNNGQGNSTGLTEALRLANTGINAGDGPAINFYWASAGQLGAQIGIYPQAAASADLIFLTGNGSSPTEKMRIKNNGHVGIGTTAPSQALEVNGQIQVDSLASSSATNLCIDGSNVISSCSSSLRYKEQIKTADFGLKEILAMRPVTFKWRGREERDFGLIAEEVAKINPLFATYKLGRIEGVKYPQMTAVIIGAIQEQQREIVLLKTANADQTAEIKSLRLRLADQQQANARNAKDIATLKVQIETLGHKKSARLASK
ncbi:MAG: tail fiber domain-containing protein [Alphaproteobacteria bacterium]|nr:tail fiber domain-containing protein [Alphaproteobacteria bacterium]